MSMAGLQDQSLGAYRLPDRALAKEPGGPSKIVSLCFARSRRNEMRINRHRRLGFHGIGLEDVNQHLWRGLSAVTTGWLIGHSG